MYRRCPPSVRIASIRPLSAYFRSVLGCSPSISTAFFVVTNIKLPSHRSLAAGSLTLTVSQPSRFAAPWLLSPMWQPSHFPLHYVDGNSTANGQSNALSSMATGRAHALLHSAHRVGDWRINLRSFLMWCTYPRADDFDQDPYCIVHSKPAPPCPLIGGLQLELEDEDMVNWGRERSQEE